MATREYEPKRNRAPPERAEGQNREGTTGRRQILSALRRLFPATRLHARVEEAIGLALGSARCPEEDKAASPAALGYARPGPPRGPGASRGRTGRPVRHAVRNPGFLDARIAIAGQILSARPGLRPDLPGCGRAAHKGDADENGHQDRGWVPWASSLRAGARPPHFGVQTSPRDTTRGLALHRRVNRNEAATPFLQAKVPCSVAPSSDTTALTSQVSRSRAETSWPDSAAPVSVAVTVPTSFVLLA